MRPDDLVAPRSLDGSAAPCARDDLLIRHIGDETVAWSPIACSPVHLPPGSAMLLKLLDGEVSTGELIDEREARELLNSELAAFDDAGLLTTSASSLDHSRKCEVFPAPPNP